MENYRSILFLQGVASPFFSALASKLEADGCQIYRVNFCGGDKFFANKNVGESWDFQEPLDQFIGWLNKQFIKHQITDIILFGDSRPVHKDAIKLAKDRQLNVHVYEEGYLRPHRITLDSGGVNASSSMPKDPAWYHQHADQFPLYRADKTDYSLLIRAWHDVRYHLASLMMKRQFPHYSTHRPEGPLREYLGWARRFPTLLFHDWNGDRVIKRLIKQKAEYYFLPLQLSADSQIRVHSPFKDVQDVIEKTVASFARNAPPHSLLVIKNHPLDTGLVPYKKIISRLEQEFFIKGRVIYLEDGYLPTMLHHAKGVVLVNSTVGTSSLFHGIPTCVLGEAIYDMKGLTYQGGLDKFWIEGKRPNPVLFAKFSRAIIHLTQVNGDFYSKKGIDMSVEGSLRLFNLPPVNATTVEEVGFETIDYIKSALNDPTKIKKSAYAYAKLSINT